MHKKNSEDYELIKSYFDEIILTSPYFAVLKTVSIEVVMNNVAISLQQNNSYGKQHYPEQHSMMQFSCLQQVSFPCSKSAFLSKTMTPREY
jgi:hypothetical protein